MRDRRLLHWLMGMVLCACMVAARAQETGDIAQVVRLGVDEQARWLADAARNGTLEDLDDERLTALFRSLDPMTVPRYLRDNQHVYASCEFTLWRRERIKGKWPKRADHMLVRVTRDPQRIYAKWLPDGAHAGQEVIYDDTTRPDELYGHLGGLLGVVPVWTSVNGSFARAQSNHSIRELSIDSITQRFLDEGRKFAEAGITRPDAIDVKTIDGVRVIAFTYETPTGQPAFYAKKEVLGLDLTRPLLRSVESFDNDGEIFESVVFGQIEEKTFDALTFDPKNPEYRF